MFEEILEKSYYHNTVIEWSIAVGIAAIVFVAVMALRAVLVSRLDRLSKKTSTHVDDAVVSVLKRTNALLLVIISLYFGSLALTLPARVSSLTDIVVKSALLLQLAFWGIAVIDFVVRSIQIKRRQEDPASASAFAVLSFFARLVFWCLIVFVMLDNIGVNITALVTGLGIGGVAIALALQNILGDIFCSIAILVDKPFEVGDFIIVGDMLGTVEKIGIKTTRVRSLSGEQLVFSNADLVGSRIRNYKRMQQRRIVFSFGVIYQTPADKLEKIPATVKEIIESLENTRFDRAHFKEYGDSSLDFECVYYVLKSDYNLYMDIQQEINLKLFRRFASDGIEFAYPTRTLYVQNE